MKCPKSPCGSVDYTDSDESFEEIINNKSPETQNAENSKVFNYDKKFNRVRVDEMSIQRTSSNLPTQTRENLEKNHQDSIKNTTQKNSNNQHKVVQDASSFEHLFYQNNHTTVNISPNPSSFIVEKMNRKNISPQVNTLPSSSSSSSFINIPKNQTPMNNQGNVNKANSLINKPKNETPINNQGNVSKKISLIPDDSLELMFRRRRQDKSYTASTPKKEISPVTSQTDNKKLVIINNTSVDDNCTNLIDPLNKTATIIREPSTIIVREDKTDPFIDEMPIKYKTTIPPIINHCIKYLSIPENIVALHLFIKPIPVEKIVKFKEQMDYAEKVNFNSPYEAAVLLTMYLRELRDPLFPVILYPAIANFLDFDVHKRPKRTHEIIKRLPDGNLKIVKCLFKFMAKVVAHSEENEMTSDIAAKTLVRMRIVRDETGCVSATDIISINTFMQYIIENHELVFNNNK